ncbi:hypothetical protein HPP92_009496 [Vanilla planifolia]|uniref:Uncharacterized protein n=1 Tax=Vanilla planifolia TaxID=51239 RepID=A0A835RFT8_VANPL|nr:hypothetical protein HPP92_009496 [Vanilla planifolia]
MKELKDKGGQTIRGLVVIALSFGYCGFFNPHCPLKERPLLKKFPAGGSYSFFPALMAHLHHPCTSSRKDYPKAYEAKFSM